MIGWFPIREVGTTGGRDADTVDPGREHEVFTIGDGEATKSLATVEDLSPSGGYAGTFPACWRDGGYARTSSTRWRWWSPTCSTTSSGTLRRPERDAEAVGLAGE